MLYNRKLQHDDESESKDVIIMSKNIEDSCQNQCVGTPKAFSRATCHQTCEMTTIKLNLVTHCSLSRHHLSLSEANDTLSNRNNSDNTFVIQSVISGPEEKRTESQTERERPECFQPRLQGKIPHMHKMQLKSLAFSAGLARNQEQITPYFHWDKQITRMWLEQSVL